jgi:hypothetical protein
MPQISNKQMWEKYCQSELTALLPILKQLGFRIKKKQPHLIGERYLMQAVTTTSGKKLILLGRRIKDNKKVIIKATSDKEGSKEIKYERTLRQALQKINFAYQVFFSPQEILFVEQNGFTILIQAFLENERSFLERPLKEQFFLALKAFKAQESAQATAYRHRRFTKKIFGNKEAKDYLKIFELFRKEIEKSLPNPKKLQALLRKAQSFLQKNAETIDQYSGFLTHTDFVPHNFRISDNKIYLLDHSSIRFGNKHEGWARFLNFMALHNPKLEQALVEYVKINKTEEESLSLQLMRIYRLGEIIYYYTNTLPKSSGDLLKLNQARIDFWSQILEAVLKNKILLRKTIQEYIRTRDSLRDQEEKERQKVLY